MKAHEIKISDPSNNQSAGDLQSSRICVIDNKFENLYFGGIRWFAQDLAVELRESFDVQILNLDSMIRDWRWLGGVPRKLKILVYDLFYFAWKLRKIRPLSKIVLPYHDCRIPKQFWSITEIFVHDDSILTLSPKGFVETAVVTYYKARLRRQLAYKGARFSTVSEDSAVRLNRLLGRQFRVQYNKLDEDYFAPFCTEKFLSYRDRINFLYSGGFHYRKNFDFACDVVTKYSELHKDARVYFYVTGQVPRDSISKLFYGKSENLTIIEAGILPTDSLVRLYRRCHVNLYPTENEGFGRVVPESVLSLCIVATQPLLLFTEITGDSKLRVSPLSLATNEWVLQIDRKLECLARLSPLVNNSEIEQLSKFRPKGN
jgi:glycosyltransferase involved in cell wall biosynthesis